MTGPPHTASGRRRPVREYEEVCATARSFPHTASGRHRPVRAVRTVESQSFCVPDVLVGSEDGKTCRRNYS